MIAKIPKIIKDYLDSIPKVNSDLTSKLPEEFFSEKRQFMFENLIPKIE